MEDWEADLSRTYNKLIRNPKLSRSNREVIEGFVYFLRAKSTNTRTILKHIYNIRWFLEAADFKIDLVKAEKQELERTFARIEMNGWAPKTKRDIKVTIKFLYKHALGEDIYYPKQIAWLKTTFAKGKKILPEDLLTEDEILKMLDKASTARDKALIALLFDSGVRIGELVGLRMKDVNLDETPAHIVVNGKTGMRKIPVMFSVPYLAQYKNLIKERKADSPFWVYTGTHINKEEPLDYDAIRIQLKRLASLAGIEKRIYPHLFRHSRASYYANKLTEQQLKAFFGWTGDSKMAAVYVHLSGRDIDNAVLQANGEKPLETQRKPKLTARICRRCQFSNTIESKYCNWCGAPIDEKVMVESQNKEEDVKQMIAEALSDPKAIEGIVHAYLMMQGKKTKK